MIIRVPMEPIPSTSRKVKRYVKAVRLSRFLHGLIMTTEQEATAAYAALTGAQTAEALRLLGPSGRSIRGVSVDEMSAKLMKIAGLA